jgi:hypothetical protein
MPTLIRLLGDSAKNTTEVRNTFKEQVLIPANARVALTGLNAVLVDDLANETFVVSGNVGQFKIGIVGNPSSGDDSPQANAVISDGDDYTAVSFVRAFEIAANYTGIAENRVALLGLHHVANLDEGRLRLQTYISKIDNADFDDEIWQIADGEPAAAVTATGFTATATVDSYTTLGNLGSLVPMVSSQFNATFVNADTVDMQISAAPFDDPGNPFWGLRVLTVGGLRRYQWGYKPLVAPFFWENVVDATAQANDTIELSRFGNAALLTIKRADGSAVVTSLARDGIAKELTDPSKGAIVWFVQANTGGEMSNCQCTKIDGLDPVLRGLNSTVTASLQFKNATGGFNSILALYCGFSGERNAIIYRGDPAIVTGRTPVGGLPGFPGVLVTLDGLGLLKSHDGAATAKSPANIVYSVNELQDKQQYLQLDVPEPLYLDVGNPSPINVNELRVRMFEAGGFNPLSFIGKPSFSFIIDYPK